MSDNLEWKAWVKSSSENLEWKARVKNSSEKFDWKVQEKCLSAKIKWNIKFFKVVTRNILSSLLTTQHDVVNFHEWLITINLETRQHQKIWVVLDRDKKTSEDLGCFGISCRALHNIYNIKLYWTWLIYQFHFEVSKISYDG